jgi:DNA-binding CsgD family transcriptional regulator
MRSAGSGREIAGRGAEDWTGQGLPLSPAQRDDLRDVLAAAAALVELREPEVWDHATAQAGLREAWTALAKAAAADPVGCLPLLTRIRELEQELSAALLHERDRAFDRLHGALDLLTAPTSMEQLLEPAVLAVTELGFDRAILSKVEDSHWLAQRVHIGRDPDWAREILDAGHDPLMINHRLVDAEMVRRRVSIVVQDVQNRPGVHRAIAGASRSRSYAAAPLVVDDEVIGFLHGDLYYQDRDPSELHRRLLGLYAAGLSQAIARLWVVEQLGAVGAQLRALSGATAPSRPALGGFHAAVVAPGPGSLRLPAPEPVDSSLTRRELEVLRLLAQGDTNAVIARRLVVSVGTVKSHVKSILRKLGADNRVEAAAYWFDQHRS